MKKLVCICIVLVISNSAFAAVANSYYVTDSSGHNEISLMTSDTIELSIWYYGRNTSCDLKIEAVGSCTLDQPVITAVSRNPVNDSIGLIETNYWEIYSASDGTNLGTGVANPLATINFQSGSPGDVTLTLYHFNGTSWDQLPAYYGMTIHEIPEPITLVFLGLGGLLLRGRK